MKELPSGKKLSHREVRYESPSEYEKEACALCEHFILVEDGAPRCQIVASPIMPEDWCKQFELDPELYEETAEEDKDKDPEQMDFAAYRKLRNYQKQRVERK